MSEKKATTSTTKKGTDEVVDSNATIDMEKMRQEMMAQIKAEMEATLREQIKNEAKAELDAEISQKEKEIKVRKKVDLDRLVEVRSIVSGTLSVLTKLEEYNFSQYGDIQEISIGELKSLKSSNPRYFILPMFIVDDEEAVEVCGLKDFYEKISFINNLKKFFNNSSEEEVIRKLKETPQYLILEVVNRVTEMWKSKEFRDIDVARLFKRMFDVDLLEE